MTEDKTYRIKANVRNDDYITIDANLLQKYDSFDVLSLSIDNIDTYRVHNSNYGMIVGRVLANNGFGIPNAKLSIFISSDGKDGQEVSSLYPFISSMSKDEEGVRYNLLPDNKVSDCHQIVGTFPNKRYMLDNDVLLEIFDKYYKFTTKTNNSGDYLLCGIPVGNHTIHMDLDLSDCGILSQRPRDFVYKGYTIEQFENPNKFKSGTEYAELSQVFTQNQVVNVRPLWGNDSLGETLGLTRADINVSFKFEPTCVFMGSVASDNASQGISKKCIPTPHMGDMDELTTGEGTIEMIRKTPAGNVEELQIKGNQLINSNGVWCYQIPMNLDYMMTDEYGNMVPTNDPDKGIPTRARVRFRISMQDNEENTDNYFRAKALVPHNPQILENGKNEEYDYEFGSLTKEESFRDLFWNNVYSVKSFIPRFQKRRVRGWNEDKFTGIKMCNHYGGNNPIPYNNIRIKLPFMFIVMCILIKIFIKIIGLLNSFIGMVGYGLAEIGSWYFMGGRPLSAAYDKACELKLNVLDQGLCPDLENWYFAPVVWDTIGRRDAYDIYDSNQKYDLLLQTYNKLDDIEDNTKDDTSIDSSNTQIPVVEDGSGDNDNEAVCLTIKTDYLISCIEMNLAQEYRVIKFDFYNDWINGLIYFPRWMRYIRPKVTFLGMTFIKAKNKSCMDDTSIFSKTRRYTQQCALPYTKLESGYSTANVPNSIKATASQASGETINVNYKGKEYKITAERRAGIGSNGMHKRYGFSQKSIFGKNGGICHEHTTSKKQHVYYLKPCEWVFSDGVDNRKVNLFATDIILLGSLNDCDLNGIPQAFKYLSSSSYIMPTNLALTNMDTNGPLYGTINDTICGGNSKYPNIPDNYTIGTAGANPEVLKAMALSSTTQNGVKVINITQENPLSAELAFYSGAGENSSFKIDFEKDELADTIALTEASGIAWNWSGPGQGDIEKRKMYYPGGHFLGLSCLNSETNIKSCLNLSRICELGTTMSQRKEDVRSISSDGKLEYAYTVPSGFISGDEIIGNEFRVMFATMNHNRLLATKTNPDTGYKIYDFTYLRPNNFDGGFRGLLDIKEINAVYNRILHVNDESYLLSKYSIADASKRDDYDSYETYSTYVRTIENESVDYNLFRMGLNYNDLSNSDILYRKFLLNDDTSYYIPQFENSYYFYFGMKYGATALDEFNKNFYSTCEATKIIDGEPMIDIKVGDVDFCDGTCEVAIRTDNIPTPYSVLQYTNKNTKEVTKITGDTLSQTLIILDIPIGEYIFTIVDMDGFGINKEIKVGTNIVNFQSEAHDFNVYDVTGIEKDEYRGGYISFYDITVSGLNETEIEYIKVQISGSGDTQTETVVDGDVDVYANKINVSYDCYLLIKKTGCSEIKIFLCKFEPKANNTLDLYIGKKNKYSFKIENPTKNEWWLNSGNIIFDNSNDDNEEKWIYRESFFKQNDNSSAYTSMIYSTNGTKATWGTPQNAFGYDYGNERWSNQINDSQYIVDSDNIFKPTYGTTANTKHFANISYNNTNVWGKKFVGKISEGTIISADNISNGYGCVFKDINTNEKIFRKFEGVGSSVPEINKGVIYAPFIYPVLDRRFYADIDFIEWGEKRVFLNNTEYYIDDTTYKGYTEGKIHNGITYKKSFGPSSYVSPNIVSISATTGDCAGISSSSSVDRITSISGYSSYSGTEITSYDYALYNGYPTEESSSIATKISDSASCKFFDTVYYNVDNNNNLTFSFEGENDGARYYYCHNDNESQIVKYNGYIKYRRNQQAPWKILCRYTSACTYNNEGEYLIAEVEFFPEEYGKCTYYKKDMNGNLIATSFTNRTPLLILEGPEPYGKDRGEQQATLLFSGATDLYPIKEHKIITSGISLKDALTIDFGGTFLDENKEIDITTGKIIDGTKYSPNGTSYIVGAYTKIGPNGGKTRIIHIITDLVEIKKTKKDSYKKVSVSPKNIDCSYNGGEAIVTVEASPYVPWKSSYPSWVFLTPSEGFSESTKVSIRWNKIYEASQDNKINFYYTKNSTPAILTLNQIFPEFFEYDTSYHSGSLNFDADDFTTKVNSFVISNGITIYGGRENLFEFPEVYLNYTTNYDSGSEIPEFSDGKIKITQKIDFVKDSVNIKTISVVKNLDIFPSKDVNINDMKFDAVNIKYDNSITGCNMKYTISIEIIEAPKRQGFEGFKLKYIYPSDKIKQTLNY